MNLDTTGMIKVIGIDLRKLVRAVYDNSVPQGLGHLRFHREGLDDASVENIVEHIPVEKTGNILYLDYVHGRECKFGLWRCQNGDLWIQKDWPGHTEFQFHKMLKEAGIKDLERSLGP